MFSFFNNAMKAACRNFLKRRDIFEQMKSRNFDVAIVEPLSVCGLGFVKALGIEKTILASSCTFYDSIMDYIGEPLDFSYVPALFSVTGDVMTMSERYENWMVTKVNLVLGEKCLNIFQQKYSHFQKKLFSEILNFPPKCVPKNLILPSTLLSDNLNFPLKFFSQSESPYFPPKKIYQKNFNFTTVPKLQ